jgi:hypothetical protein
MSYKDLKLRVNHSELVGSGLTLLKLALPADVPEILPGQFVNILAPKCADVLLRRPISVCDVREGQLWILVKDLGRGSRAIGECRPGDELEVLLPLGHGFSTEVPENARLLLVGGGVGIAPLLYLGRKLREIGRKPEYILGGRTAADVPMLYEFGRFGKVHVCTEDGSVGTKGFVTDHPLFAGKYDMIYCCGPKPMMLAVAKSAKAREIDCEVSLENKMACGLGACLCCVEETTEGNLCTCTHGPVFNINQLTWPI